MKKCIATILLTALVIGSTGLYAGYRAGQYTTTEDAQKHAIASGCGSYVGHALVFEWNTTSTLDAAQGAIPNMKGGIHVNGH